MAERRLRLHPFPDPGPDDGPSQGLQLEVVVVREGLQLALSYRLQGDLSELTIPPPAEQAERRDELWRATCFEAFLAAAGAEPYWELNLSPAGHWNLYQLDGYRRGLRPESRCPAPKAQITVGPQLLSLEVQLDLAALLPAGSPLELAPTAVLQSRGGACSYWATVHPAPEPDFHHRKGFVALGSPPWPDAPQIL